MCGGTRSVTVHALLSGFVFCFLSLVLNWLVSLVVWSLDSAIGSFFCLGAWGRKTPPGGWRGGPGLSPFRFLPLGREFPSPLEATPSGLAVHELGRDAVC